MAKVQEKANINWAVLIMLGLAQGAIFRVAYLNTTFYPTLREALGVTNEQLGNLSSMYGIVAIVFYALGGLIADKFRAKYCISIGLLGTGAASFWYSTMPSYTSLIFIFMTLSFFNILIFWSALIKAIRNCGDDSCQGRVFGFNQGVWAASSAGLSFLVVFIISSSSSELSALVLTLRFYTVLYFVLGILAFFLIGKDEQAGEQMEGGVKLKEIGAIIRQPGIYLCATIIFCVYSIYGSISYLTPYLSEIFGMDPQDPVLNGVSVARTYAIGILGGPIAGIMADKMGSAAKWISYCAAASFLLLLGFIFMPLSANILVPILLMFMLSCVVSFMRSTYMATLSEAKIPIAATGTAVGLVSMVGYLPDAFMYTMMGSWLDNYPGVAGYQRIFIYLCIMAVIAIAMCTALLTLKTKMELKNNKIL